LGHLLVRGKSVDAEWDDAGVATVTFAPTPAVAASGPFEVSAALLGGGIESKVNRGENSGRTLEHEFAALKFAREILVPVKGDEAVFRAVIRERHGAR